MQLIRKTKSRCPQCIKEVDGEVVVADDGKAYIHRECPEHGPYDYLLSVHGEDYADLDRFFTEVYETSSPGRRFHSWIMATMKCQQRCPYCTTDCANDKEEIAWEEMSWDDILEIMKTIGKGKFSFSGGEPTLHPKMFEFFREADRRGILAQLATNGLMMTSKEYCQKLKDNKIKEVRLSLESITEEDVASLGLDAYVKPKLKAIENLCEVGIPITLSPTIFRGVNEQQLYHILEYAKDKPAIHAFSAEGFSWNGSGIRMPPEMMIAPDELMDILHPHYCKCDRRDQFAFQKMMFAILNVVGFELCLKTEFMVFLRRPEGLKPFIEYINIRRVGKMLDWWRRIIPRQRWIRALLLLPVLASGVTLKTFPLAPMLLRLLWANRGNLDVSQYPSELMVVAFNTNCSTLNADSIVVPHCVTRFIYKRDGAIVSEDATDGLLGKEERNFASGVWQQMLANKWQGPDANKDQ